MGEMGKIKKKGGEMRRRGNPDIAKPPKKLAKFSWNWS